MAAALDFARPQHRWLTRADDDAALSNGVLARNAMRVADDSDPAFELPTGHQVRARARARA